MTDRKEYMRQWRLKNKEYAKEYQSKNKEHIAEHKKEYRQTPKGKKSNTINNWKQSGVIHDDFDELYSLYIATTECMVCHTAITDSYYRCLDHNHETGAYRNVLCRTCNNQDNWAKRA